LKNEIVKKRQENESKLAELGPALPRTHADKFEFMWKMTEDLVALYNNEIQGKYDPERSKLRRKEGDPSIGFKIRKTFDEFFADFVKPDFKCSGNYTNQDITDAINRFQTVGIPGFPSIDAFLFLINPKLEELRSPSLSLIDKIFRKMEKLVRKLSRNTFGKFPEVESEVLDIIMKDLTEVIDSPFFYKIFFYRKKQNVKRLSKHCLNARKVGSSPTVLSIRMARTLMRRKKMVKAG
jgi:hypothetical protein